MASSTTHRYEVGDRLVLDHSTTSAKCAEVVEVLDGTQPRYVIEAYEYAGTGVGVDNLRRVRAEVDEARLRHVSEQEYWQVQTDEWQQYAARDRKVFAAVLAEHGVNDAMPCPPWCCNAARFGTCKWDLDYDERPLRSHSTESLSLHGEKVSVELSCTETLEGISPWRVAINADDDLTMAEARRFAVDLTAMLDRYENATEVTR
jgi:hypothetical protein